MNEVKVSGSIANYLMKAVEHMAKLEVEMERLRHSVAYEPGREPWAARTHCRKLMEALKMVEFCIISDREEAKANVVEMKRGGHDAA